MPATLHAAMPSAAPKSGLARLFGFSGPPAVVHIELSGTEDRKRRSVVELGKTRETLFVFDGTEPIAGTVVVRVPAGEALEHLGVKLELKGVMQVYQDKTRPYEFCSAVEELAPPGVLRGENTYDFNFASTPRRVDSFTGINVRVRYFLQATVSRSGMASNISDKRDFLVEHTATPPPANAMIRMEVGIEDFLHIEFEYDREHYHLKDVLVGRVKFHLVKLRIKYMELALLRREITSWGGQTYTETEVLAKFEVMDGAPVRDEIVPVRMFLSAYDLTPTYEDVENTFSVRYFVNLVLVDEGDRRYFKQHEIKLFRKFEEGGHKEATSLTGLKTLPRVADFRGTEEDEEAGGHGGGAAGGGGADAQILEDVHR